MKQRPGDARAGRVERRGHRLQRRLEGEERGDHLDHVVERRADRAGGDQREEGDRQGDHEGEQGDRPDLARRRPERRPGRAQAPPRRRRSPAARARSGSSAGGRRRPGRPASAASPAGRPRPRARPSRPAAPSGETRPRVSRGKAFSSRSSASEPATSRTVTKARVKVAATAIAKISSGGAEALTTCLSTAIGWVSRVSSGAGGAEVVARERGEAKSPGRASRAARPAAASARTASRMRARVAAGRGSGSPGRAPSNWPPLTTRPRNLPPSCAIRRAITRLAWVSSELIRSLTRRALTGSSSLTITSTSGVLGRRGRERVDPVDQVGGQDQRRQHVAGADLVDGFGAALHVDALDPLADPVADADLAAARWCRRRPAIRPALR